MKKSIAVLLFFVMVAVSFSSCKQKSDKYSLKQFNDSESSESSKTGSSDDKTVSEKNKENGFKTNGGLNSSQEDIGTGDDTSVKQSSSVTSPKGFGGSPKSKSGKTSNKNSSGGPANSSSGTNSGEYENTKDYALPDYDLDTDYTNDYVEDGRNIKIKTFATEKEYKDYVDKLIKSGYKKYDENKIGSNLFVSLVDKNTFVSVSFMSGNKKLKIISEPLCALYPRKSDNKYTSKGLKSLFTGMKNENKPIYSGMGFVIRLNDGSFIIIDGGGGDRNHKDSNNLLSILNEQKPKGSGKPVIAAWIFTHCHDDHIGVFNAFSEDFHDKVIIENFYYNFPPDLSILDTAKFMFNDDYYSYNTFKNCMSEYYSKSKTIRPHAGEKYYIRNCVIEMLFSYEDLLPASISAGNINDFNETSIMFKMNIGGQSLLITGDASAMSMNFACVNYGSYLKSDILQMAHHGQNGTVPFYTAVNPTYALIPISHVDTNRVTFNDANKWLINSKKLRQFIVFWGQNVTIPLPFNPTNSEITDRIPKATTKYNFKW